MPNTARNVAPNDDASILHEALRRAASPLGLTFQELGDMVGVSAQFFSRKPGRLTAKQAELSKLTLRVYRSLSAIMGGNTRNMRHWIETQNHALHGAPKDRMKTIAGLVATVEYLDAHRGKL